MASHGKVQVSRHQNSAVDQSQAIDAMIAEQLRTKPDALHVFDSAAVEAFRDPQPSGT
jgi:hypothetical protein